MSGSKNVIAILARYPRLGEVKTRLTPPLSAEDALALHDRLTRHALRRALAVAATGDARVEVRTDAAFPRVAYDWLGSGFRARYQGEGDLGDRIRLAFGDSFGRGRERVVVVGSDCPRLTSAHLRDALRRLSGIDIVLGPATDGGYYLVALRRETAKQSVPVLFTDVPWGTADVLDRTISIAEKAGLSYVLLEPLPDVDRPEDVAPAEEALALDELPADATVSVVIPALNEAGCIGAAVASALDGGAAEVIVADGGSSDATAEIASAAGARVIVSATGRATQMNAGAAEAVGDILLFQHADTVLPPKAARLAREALGRAGVVAGAFGYAVDSATATGRLVSTLGRARARVTHHPYGDQGLFVSAGVFRDLGGYPEMPTLEDWEFVARLRRLGRVHVLRERAVTSLRAWEQRGLVATTVVNAAVIAGYRLGLDPERLARWRQRAVRR